MEQKLQLYAFVLLIQVSLAKWQQMTVIKGQTVDLSCPVTNSHQTNMDWKNPEGYIMFFRHNAAAISEGLKEKRYSINNLSESHFTISISDVTFQDGGNYTCTQYGNHATEKTVELTVLGLPKIIKTKHEGRFNITCTAEGNKHPPQIFWKLDHGPEILAHPQDLHEDKKYITRAMLHIQSVENRVEVVCLVRHPALLSHPLMDTVKIGQRDNSRTELPGPGKNVSTLNTTNTDTELINSWTSTTTEIPPYNHTEGNGTGSINDPKMQMHSESSSLLVFLVTCLIFGLLVVVFFFAIELRRTHMTWKKENEDSDPSEESSKSKSSQEEKNFQGQRRRGLFNTAFAQYNIEEPSVVTSVINNAMAAMESAEEQTSQTPTPRQSTISTKCVIRETEL